MKSSHKKAVERMERETNRAVLQVKFLEKLYLEMMEKKKKEVVQK
jgi:hypothetical protein